MRTASLALALIASAACAARRPPCAYEENCGCAAPGITVRWKAAYCLARAETDDVLVDAVQDCLAEPEPAALAAATPCERNAHWKALLCRARHAGDEGGAARCRADPAFVPRIVAEGA